MLCLLLFTTDPSKYEGLFSSIITTSTLLTYLVQKDHAEKQLVCAQKQENPLFCINECPKC